MAGAGPRPDLPPGRVPHPSPWHGPASLWASPCGVPRPPLKGTARPRPQPRPVWCPLRPQLVGMPYLHEVLQPVISRVFEEKKYMELDPCKMELGRTR